MSTVLKPSAAPALRLCPACRTGHLQAGHRERVFHPHGQPLVVPLLTSVCDNCGAEAPSAAQHSENLQRLAARKAQYGNVLMGEEILSLRRRFGLTQQVASRIFGKGKIAFSRYESETTYPDESTTRLLAMAIAKPETLKWLADQEGIEIPLWGERCEDEQRVKVRSLTKVYDAAQASTKHQERYVSSGGSTGSTKWVGSFSKLWAATVVANRQTLMLSEAGHEASNEHRMVREAVAS